MPQFTPNRSLLNPQFEGYKLSFTPSPNLQYFPLPHRASQSRFGTDVHGFQEVASRVRHNHLAVGAGNAMYIAEDGSVVHIRMDDDKLDLNDGQEGLTFSVVFHLPEFMSDSPRVQAEYPAAAYLAQDTWLVSDGHGTASLISTLDGGSTTEVVSCWELRPENATVPSPFQLLGVAIVAPHLAIAILSSRYLTSNTTSPLKIKEQLFDIWAVRVPLPAPASSPFGSASSPSPFQVVWHRRGTNIPLFATYAPARDAFLLIGGSSYHDVISQPVQPYEPTPDEFAPISHPGENSDTSMSVPPYSWTQTEDTITLAFALPGTTPKASIHVTFATNTLSLRVGSPSLPPLYADAPLWDVVHPATCLWTWERGDATHAGLLSLHLDKLHVGTRWSHIFEQGFEQNEVTETLDPSELAAIRETFDKYTASLQHGAGGLGHGVSTLAEGERDIEVDSSVGHQILLTWVANNGSTSGPVDDAPAVLLSLPLPGLKDTLSLVIKNDIDGPLYTLDDASENPEWNHVATYPALGFVLASKRDTRFTFHVSSSAAFAFESGARNNGGGNVYMYRGSAPGDKWAKQGVFQQQPDAGALLGVGTVASKTGQWVLLCLSERELAVCRGLL